MRVYRDARVDRSFDRSRRQVPTVSSADGDSTSRRFRARGDRLTTLEHVNVSRPRAVLHRTLTETLFDADAPRDAVEVDSFDGDERREFAALVEGVEEFLDDTTRPRRDAIRFHAP